MSTSIAKEGCFETDVRNAINTNFSTHDTQIAALNGGTAGVVRAAGVTLTSAQVKALRATPQTVVAAPGAGYRVVFIRGSAEMKYGGTNAFTENVDNLALKYTNGSGVQVCTTIECTGFIDQTASTCTSIVQSADAIVASSAAENAPLVLHNIGAHEFAGNAAGDNTLKVVVYYAIVSVA